MSYHRQQMQRALELATRGAWSSPPNPQVGCVICQQQTVVGEGWHVQPGGAHAEIMALQQAGSQAEGASVYVTLEPCAHQGRTGPCCDALIAAQVARVFIAVADPNPKVNGEGVRRLNEAGIVTEIGLLETESRALNAGFMSRFERGRPRVRMKMAASLDGQTATHNGHSKWITSPPARADVQALRAGSGAIMTGIGTLLADDPQLNVRHPDASRQPLRVIVDSRLRTPPAARMVAAPGKVLIATSAQKTESMDTWRALPNVEIIDVADAQGRVDLDGLMSELASREINDVHVECGPELAGNLLQQRLVDELIFYFAAKFIGHNGQGMFKMPAIDKVDHALNGKIKSVTHIGPDIRVDVDLANRTELTPG